MKRTINRSVLKRGVRKTVYTNFPFRSFPICAKLVTVVEGGSETKWNPCPVLGSVVTSNSMVVEFSMKSPAKWSSGSVDVKEVISLMPLQRILRQLITAATG